MNKNTLKRSSMISNTSSIIDEKKIDNSIYLFNKYKKRIQKIYPKRSSLTYIEERAIVKRNLKIILSPDILNYFSVESKKAVFFNKMIDYLKQTTFFTLPYIKYKYGEPTYLNFQELFEKSSKGKRNLLNEMMEKKLKRKMENVGIQNIFVFLETTDFKPVMEIDELYTWQPTNIMRDRGFWYIALHSVFPNFQHLLLERIKKQIIKAIKKGYKVNTIRECLEKLPLFKFLSSHTSEFGLKNIEKFFHEFQNQNNTNFFSRKYIQNVEEMDPELNIVILDFIFSNIDLYNLEHNLSVSPISKPLLVISHSYWCECESYGIRGTKIEKSSKLKKTCQNFHKNNFLQTKTNTDFTKENFWNFLEPGICIKYSTVSFDLEVNGTYISFCDVPLDEYIGLIEKDDEFKDLWLQRGVKNWDEEIYE